MHTLSPALAAWLADAVLVLHAGAVAFVVPGALAIAWGGGAAIREVELNEKGQPSAAP